MFTRTGEANCTGAFHAFSPAATTALRHDVTDDDPDQESLGGHAQGRACGDLGEDYLEKRDTERAARRYVCRLRDLGFEVILQPASATANAL